MNIAYFCHDTNSMSGANKALKFIVLSMKRCGHRITIVAPNSRGLIEDLCNEGVYCISVPFYYGIYPSRRKLLNKFKYIPKLLLWRVVNQIAVRKICTLLKNDDIQIIHSNTSVLDVGYKVARRLRCCHLYHIREYVNDYLGVSYYPSNKAFAIRIQSKNKYSYTACINPDIQSRFALINSKYSRVVYDGVMPQKQKMKYPIKQGYYIYIGRIEYKKGLLQLIEGYIDYLKESHKKMPLKVLGSINQEEYYDQIIATLSNNNALDKVEFCGMQKNVSAFLLNANGIIVPSLSEGFGFCMAEAMFNECPVIGLDISGTHLQFENGLNLIGEDIGYRYHNRNELKEALLKLENTDNSIMVENAWKVVNTLYTQERNYNEIIKYYNFIIENES